MALKSNLKNMVISLTAICLVCSAILAGAYAITKKPIEKAQADKLMKSLTEVLPEFASSEKGVITVDGVEYPYDKALDADGNVIGYAITSKTAGFGGTLSVLVGITADGIVHNTSVLSHSETPGLGAKCTSDEKFMSQWKGLDFSAHSLTDGHLTVSKDGGDIDAITASTITSRAYTTCVNQAYAAFQAIINEEN